MAKNFIQEGKRIKYTAEATVSSGALMILGTLAAVAMADVALGEKGAAAVEGVWELEKKAAGVEISQGDKLYWDADGDPQGGEAGSGCITNVDGGHTHDVTVSGEAETVTSTEESAGNVPIGIAWADAAAAASTVKAKINA